MSDQELNKIEWLPITEEAERQLLLSYRRSTTRWMTQEEQDRLAYLQNKIWNEKYNITDEQIAQMGKPIYK